MRYLIQYFDMNSDTLEMGFDEVAIPDSNEEIPNRDHGSDEDDNH
jgi:hypothetical protein